jgi:hypothetical protein
MCLERGTESSVGVSNTIAPKMELTGRSHPDRSRPVQGDDCTAHAPDNSSRSNPDELPEPATPRA